MRSILPRSSSRRLLRALALLSACLTGSAGLQAADAGPIAFPVYRSATEVRTACDATMQALEAQARRVARAEGGENVLIGMEGLNRTAEDRIYTLSFLANVHPDKPLRDAAEACELRYQSFSSRLLQDRRIHARLVAFEPADAIDAQLRRDLIASFEDAGVALSPARRERARALNNQIARLGQAFDRRVREDRTRVAFTPAELEGVDEAVWKKAPTDARGRRLIGLDYPSYIPVVESARRPATRERLWRAFQNRGGVANLDTLAQIGRKRLEYARLFGLPSYADFMVRRRMAGSVPRVQAFLGEVKEAVRQRELRDIEDLRAAKAADLGTPPEATRIQRWDSAYYTERVKRERFSLDQNSFRKHFPPQASVDFVMALAGRMFQVGFRPVEQTLWHPDAKAYEVFDPADGRSLATLYLDLYPRPDKYSHAACWGLRGSSTLAGRLPASALVTNFDREGLTLEELETLLHEFGHALHGTLSATRYSSNAGTGVKLDFVEAPSQMLEEWVYDARALALMGEVCPSCEPVPGDLLERAVRSRSFGKGLQFARQHVFASFDLALHGPDAPEPLATWAKLEGAMPLGHVKGTLFPANFSHVAGGYGAGYYAYLWSLATAQDLYTAFAADPLDPAIGRRYREGILAPGGQVDPDELVTRFLGRPMGNEAFFRWLER